MSTSLKSAGQNLLKSLGLYQRVKASFAYDLYWRFADPRLIEDRDREVSFFRETLQGLQAGDLVFDIGANQGHKTGIFLRLGARVVAVDPDRSNQEILRQNHLSYRLGTRPVVIVGKAVSDANGIGTFWMDAPGSAKNTLNKKWVDTLKTDSSRFGDTLAFAESIEVETITLDELIRQHGQPFYIKIDVEGHEPGVLRGLHTPVRYVSFEVNLPEFRAEAVECVELLQRLEPRGLFNYTATCIGEMALPEWLPKEGFLQAFARCSEPSLEIFWKTEAGR